MQTPRALAEEGRVFPGFAETHVSRWEPLGLEPDTEGVADEAEKPDNRLSLHRGKRGPQGFGGWG